MKHIQALHQETKLLLQTLKKLEMTKLDRSQALEYIQVHIAKRDQLLKEIVPPYTEEEMNLGKKIIDLNKEIKYYMDHLHEEMMRDIKQVQQLKKQNYSYINPYGKMKTSDGIYMDNKL